MSGVYDVFDDEQEYVMRKKPRDRLTGGVSSPESPTRQALVPLALLVFNERFISGGVNVDFGWHRTFQNQSTRINFREIFFTIHVTFGFWFFSI